MLKNPEPGKVAPPLEAEDALGRRAILRAFRLWRREHRGRRTATSFLAEYAEKNGWAPSRTTLYRWQKSYRDKGIGGLSFTSTGFGPRDEWPKEAREFFLNAWRNRLSENVQETILKLVAESRRRDWPVPSEFTMRTFLKRYGGPGTHSPKPLSNRSERSAEEPAGVDHE